MPQIIHTSGKRKRAIARAVIKPGKGMVRINSRALSIYKPELAKEKITEPLIIAGDEITKKIKKRLSLNLIK